MKVVTLIIKVDLCCCRCKAKIQKVLCKLQKCDPIQEIVYDGKDTVTVTGPFDPECLSSKIRCKAGKIIICIKLKPPPSTKVDPPQKVGPPSPPSSPTLVKVVEWNWPKDPPPWFKPCSCCKGHQGCCSCSNFVNVMPQFPAPVCGGSGVTIVYNDDPAPGCNIM